MADSVTRVYFEEDASGLVGVTGNMKFVHEREVCFCQPTKPFYSSFVSLRKPQDLLFVSLSRIKDDCSNFDTSWHVLSRQVQVHELTKELSEEGK